MIPVHDLKKDIARVKKSSSSRLKSDIICWLSKCKISCCQLARLSLCLSWQQKKQSNYFDIERCRINARKWIIEIIEYHSEKEMLFPLDGENISICSLALSKLSTAVYLSGCYVHNITLLFFLLNSPKIEPTPYIGDANRLTFQWSIDT